jgi:hypothetical protein
MSPNGYHSLDGLKVGDIVEHVRTYEHAKVTRVDHQFGSFSVEFLTGPKRNYTMNKHGSQQVRMISAEERADLFLKLENTGLTDFWRD